MMRSVSVPVAVGPHGDPLRRSGPHSGSPAGGSSAASSGAGLPSALLTPRGPQGVLGASHGPPHDVSGGSSPPGYDQPGPCTPDGTPSDLPCQQHQRQQHPGAAADAPPESEDERARRPSSGARGVRWADEAAGGPRRRSIEAPAARGGGDDGAPRDAAGGEAGGGGGGLPAGSPLSAAAVAAEGRRAPLPESGSAQLDKYLLYLLRGEHPHKFMYYPGWGLPDDACAALGAFFRADRRIKMATLSGNRIQDDGAELLAQGLAANRTLACLDLSDNRIGDSGALALAQALSDGAAGLTELNLNSNCIGDEGAEALAAAAASAPQLKKLQLSGNGISSSQMKVVHQAIKARSYKVPPQHKGSAGNLSALGARAPSAAPSGGGGLAGAASGLLRRMQQHHKRDPSLLQFDIELAECEEAAGRSAQLVKQSPAAVVAALCEPVTHLEGSIASQCAHVAAVLEAEARPQVGAAAADCQGSGGDGGGGGAAGPGAPGTTAVAAAAAVALAPMQLLQRLAVRLARLGYVVNIRCTAGAGHVQNGAGAAQQHHHHQQQQQQQQQAQQQHHQQQQHHHHHQHHQQQQDCPQQQPADHQHALKQHGAQDPGQQHPQNQEQQQSQHAGRHAFIVVQQPDELTAPVVVDPDFASQFVLPAADRRYQQVFEALPPILVMQESRLFFLLEALCSEMGAAFEALGRPLPPWRGLELVAAKWQPRRFVDVAVPDGIDRPTCARGGGGGAPGEGGGGGAAAAGAGVGAGAGGGGGGAWAQGEQAALEELRRALVEAKIF